MNTTDIGPHIDAITRKANLIETIINNRFDAYDLRRICESAAWIMSHTNEILKVLQDNEEA